MLIRSVSWAIWTLTLPVSRSFAPYCAASSRLRSVVRVIECSNASRRANGPGSLDVPVHLLDERLHGLEAFLAAQPLEEVQAQLLAVEVALEIDQVGLDELRATGAERRPHADAHRRGPAVGQRGVDAVSWAHHAVGRDEGGGREGQLAAPLIARDHDRTQLEGVAEEDGRACHLAGRDQRADLARGDDLAVVLAQRDDARAEAAVCGK